MGLVAPNLQEKGLGSRFLEFLTSWRLLNAPCVLVAKGVWGYKGYYTVTIQVLGLGVWVV